MRTHGRNSCSSKLSRLWAGKSVSPSSPTSWTPFGSWKKKTPAIRKRCRFSSARKLKSPHRERLRVEGILNVPGHGPVLLATNAAADNDRINVRWACDRRVHFVANLASDADLQQALDDLQAERVVAITISEQTLAQA